MKARNFLLAALVLPMLAACQAGKNDAQKLAVVEQTNSGTLASQPVSCTDISEVCGRLYEEHGASCLKMAEAADPATRATMRSCAVNDFRQAIAHLPPASNKLIATRGLAQADLINRDNAPDEATRNANAAELDSLAAQLQSMPGGAAYGGYYAANNGLNRVLTRKVPQNQACPTLKNAQAQLPTAGVPDDLKVRVTDLRNDLTTAITRSCV